MIGRESLLKKNEIGLSSLQQSMEGGSLEGASDPSNVQGEHDHYFDRAKAFIALRALPSRKGKSETGYCVLSTSFFFLELRVWRGEISEDMPHDQVKDLASF
jgi:hypothetical protein